jgi:hypothetical protein
MFVTGTVLAPKEQASYILPSTRNEVRAGLENPAQGNTPCLLVV